MQLSLSLRRQNKNDAYLSPMNTLNAYTIAMPAGAGMPAAPDYGVVATEVRFNVH